MTKKEILTQLRAAKTAHIQWRSYAHALTSGLPVQPDYAPLIHTECKFGQWYYGPGQMLSSLVTYEAIDAPHETLHQIYMKLFKILFTHEHEERSFFQKLLGSKGRIDKKQQEEVDSLMQNLLMVSRTLLETIALLEQEVLQMSDEEIAALADD